MTQEESLNRASEILMAHGLGYGLISVLLLMVTNPERSRAWRGQVWAPRPLLRRAWDACREQEALQDSGSSGSLHDHSVNLEGWGEAVGPSGATALEGWVRCCSSRASPGVSLTVRLEPSSMQVSFGLTNLPGHSLGRRLLGLRFRQGQGGCPNPFLSKGAAGKPQVSGLSLGVCSVSEMQWLELYFSLESHLPQDV